MSLKARNLQKYLQISCISGITSHFALKQQLTTVLLLLLLLLLMLVVVVVVVVVVMFFFNVWSMVILRNTTLQIKLGLDHNYTMVTPKRQRSCQLLRTVLPWCRYTHRRCWPYGRSRMPSCRQGWWRLANGALGFFADFKRSEPWFCSDVFSCFLIINCLYYDYCIYIYIIVIIYTYSMCIYVYIHFYICFWVLYTYYCSECILFLFWQSDYAQLCMYTR